MKFMITGRCEGKSHQLAEWAREAKGHVVVVCNQEMARGFREKYDIPERQVLTHTQVLRGAHRGRRATFAVDDIGCLLQLIFGACEVEIVTATGELVPVPALASSVAE